MKLYWRCPKCNSIVDFTKQMQYIFSDEDEIGYEADFDPEQGVWLYTIECEGCNSVWSISIGARGEE